jgi:hypothetical protein
VSPSAGISKQYQAVPSSTIALIADSRGINDCLLTVLLSLLSRGNFMQERRPPTAEQERRIEKSKRAETERKREMTGIEIVCQLETGVRSTSPPHPPLPSSNSSPPPQQGQKAEPHEIAQGLLLAPVEDEIETVNYVSVSINHSAEHINVGAFDLHEMLEVVVFDSNGDRVPAVTLPKRGFVTGYMRWLSPGETFSTPLFLEEWAEIKGPGTYRLEISTKGDVHSLMKIRNRTLTYTIEEDKTK